MTHGAASEELVTVAVDPDVCTGHGRCNATAPEIYDLDDDGYCVIRRIEVVGALAAIAREGADNCPERAITVRP
jgi:ferredoxin